MSTWCGVDSPKDSGFFTMTSWLRPREYSGKADMGVPGKKEQAFLCG